MRYCHEVVALLKLNIIMVQQFLGNIECIYNAYSLSFSALNGTMSWSQFVLLRL